MIQNRRKSVQVRIISNDEFVNMIQNRRRSVQVRIISNEGFANISYMIQNRRRSVQVRIISNEEFANMIQNRKRSVEMRIISNDGREYTIQDRYIKTKESKKIRQKKRKEKLTYAYILTPNCTGYIVRVLFAIIR